MARSLSDRIKSWFPRINNSDAAILPFINRHAAVLRTGIAALLVFALFLFLVSDAIPGINDPGLSDSAGACASAENSSLESASSAQSESAFVSLGTDPASSEGLTPSAASRSATPSTSPAPAGMGVAIPSNLTPGIPEGIRAVPAGQTVEWMPYLTLFPTSARCAMYLYIDPAVASVQETSDRITAVPPGGGGNGTISGAGLLIAFHMDRSDYKTELLAVNLEFIGTGWRIVPVRNTAAAGGSIPLTQQLRIVSPRLPLTKAQVNDTSKLQSFDPSPYAASGKSPFRMREAAIHPLMAMLQQAASDGITQITVRDTYRGYEQQDSMFQSIIRYYQGTGYSYNDALARTQTETAEAGTSEHHDGFTADMITIGATMDQGFGLTPFGVWLQDHCWENGFIIRYTAGKEIQTTKKYEPWHVRFVGLPTSLFIQKYGIVLDEFHAYLAEKQFAFAVLPDKEKGGVETSIYLYVRCGSGNGILLPDGIPLAASTLLSEVGDGRVVLLCKIG